MTDHTHMLPSARGLGIATLYDGTQRYDCGLLLWCASARALATKMPAALQPADVVLISPRPHADCNGSLTVWPAGLHSATKQYSRRLVRLQAAIYKNTSRDPSRSLRRDYFLVGTMMKMAIFSLEQHSLVLFADLDVDLLPRRVLHVGVPFDVGAFERATNAFLSSRSWIVGAPDPLSPINAGLLLAKPRMRLFAQIVELLQHNVSFDPQLGYNGIGQPRALLRKGRIDLGMLECGSGAPRKTVLRLLERALRRDAWTFAGASIDQGFIWWLFFLVHQRGTWAERMGTYGPAHFWGAVKPWRPSALGQGARNLTVAYLWRLAELGSSDKSNVSPGSSKCRGLLEDIKERLQRERSWFEPTPATLQAANLGWLNTSRCLHCILPSPNIAA